jgi:hypothetical protein
MEENKGKEYFVLLVESVWRVKRGRKSGIRNLDEKSLKFDWEILKMILKFDWL